MTKGPNRQVLDQYLDSAAEGVVKNAGVDWKKKADDLQTLAEALKQAAEQAELRIGEQTLTGPALRASMEKTSTSMIDKSEQLRTAGEALKQVGVQLADTRDTRDSMAELGAKPAPYQAPAATPGIDPTPEEIKAQADASKARSDERGAWQSQYDKQEAKALALTREMDAAFLGAIPPMKAIHGQSDPTEPPPDVPTGPGGPYLPGTQAPPVTGGGGDGDKDRGHLVITDWEEIHPPPTNEPPVHPPKHPPVVVVCPPFEPPTTHPPTTHPPTITEPPQVTPTHHTPSTSVGGTSQEGIAYQPSGGSSGSAPGSVAGSVGSGSGSGAGSAVAFGAAGGAGGMAAGTVRPGSLPSAPAGSAPARPIGASGRAASTGALSRTTGASAGSTAARPTGAGSAGARGASAGSTSGRGSAGGRGGAGSSGSRSGSRGSSGARSAGSAGGRGGRRGKDEQSTERDSLVYDQDWLGDDDVAPGVLD